MTEHRALVLSIVNEPLALNKHLRIKYGKLDLLSVVAKTSGTEIYSTNTYHPI